MHIKDCYTFKCEREKVWEGLMDTEVLGKIIPGSKGLQAIGKNKYQSALEVKKGPLKGRVKFEIELADIKAPKSCRLIVKGKVLVVNGKITAGRVTSRVKIRLAQENGATVMRYDGDVYPGGVIAAVGKKKVDKEVKRIPGKLSKAICRRGKAPGRG